MIKMKKELNRLRSTSYTFRAITNHASHSELRQKSNRYGEAIIQAKRSHWANYLEEMTANEMWTANKYIKEPIDDGGSPRIPTLRTRDETGREVHINNNEEKARAFAKIFFPPPPPEDHSFDDYVYPVPLPDPPENHAGTASKTHIQARSV